MRIIFGNMKLTFDVDGVISKFGGPSELARFLNAGGFQITKQAVTGWRRGGVVPMRVWIALCEMTAKGSALTLDLRKFLVKQ